MHDLRPSIGAVLGGVFSVLGSATAQAEARDGVLRRALAWSTGSERLDPLEEFLGGTYRAALAQSEALRALDGLATRPEGQLVLVGGIVLLLAVIVLGRRLRGTGSLTLELDFSEAIDGDFEVQLHRKSQKRARASAVHGKPEQARKAVRRETQFDRVPTGPWFLTIEGELRARRSGAVLASVFEEVAVRIVAQQSTTVRQSLPPVETPVAFRIQWDRQPARDVGVRLRRQPDSLRYAGHGFLQRTLPLGAHVIVIGAGDRVIEQTLAIEDYEPRRVQIDLALPETLVFKGCPPAVQSFLQGDLGGAARALERDGQDAVAALLRARVYQEQGQTAQAAEALEHAGQLREAADLRRSISEFECAAALYERAGALREAAEMYDAARDPARAARAYATLEAWSEAARCFEAAGDSDGLIEALEALGDLLRAAAIASEQDDRRRAIQLLQQVGPQDPQFGRAAELLALAFEQEGHLDLAAHHLARRLDSLSPDEPPSPQLESHLAELLEETGEWSQALEVLERLRERDPTVPHVGSRIESLRKRLSSPATRATAPIPGASGFTPPPGATAFVAQERYEILEEIGRGGMGLVFKARDRRLNRVIALKRMPESLRDHPGAVQLFLGEAQAAARMNHPNIVTLHDADQEHGAFFITMELLEGLPLNTILKQRGAFGPRDTARLGVQVCAGLQYAHAQGIVHRDIKTANLFITRERVLKIMDFGLAKILEAVRENGQTLIAGTPFYMAPEQSAGQVTDGRTDLYALGVTLFELSTGRLPFAEGDIADQHRHSAVPDPAQGRPDYPVALARLIQQLMAKDPEDRPPDAATVATALDRIIETHSR